MVGVSGYSPYQMVFGRERNLAGLPFSTPLHCAEAEIFINDMQKLDELLAGEINKIHDSQKGRHNAHQRGRPAFKIGDKVWVLKPKPLGGHKIATWWSGPFEITSQNGEHSFVVNLGGQEELEVHQSQLKPFLDPEHQGEGIHLNYHFQDHPKALPLSVEKIRGHRRGPDGLQFLTHWKGGSGAQDTWEEVSAFLIPRSNAWVEYCQLNGLWEGMSWTLLTEGVHL